MFVYADDFILIAPSVTELERLLHICEKELESLDMPINFKNRVALELSFAVTSNVLTLSVSQVTEMRSSSATGICQ